MSEKKFIDDRAELERLAPVAKTPVKKQIFVCNGKACLAVGAAEVKAAFEAALQSRNLRRGRAAKGRNPAGEVMLTDCGSVGLCAVGAAVLVYPEGVWYAQVRPDDAEEIVREHIEQGNVVQRLAIVEMSGDR